MILPPAACARLVVKIGSALLVAPDGAVRRDWLAGVAADIAARRAAGQAVVVVSSGAIALGARRLALPAGGRATLEDAQAAAAVGQVALAGLWAELLADAGLTAAQMLVTPGDLEDRRRYLNVAATLRRLLALGAVPVVNENDTVATAEIRFGDNDRLAARIAGAAAAEGVLLLSDVDGLYDRNPALPGAAHIACVADVDAVAGMADAGSASGMGSGGMAAKLAAARIAVAGGIPLAIADGRPTHPLATPARHTIFTSAGPRGPARRAWLTGRMHAEGTIHVDAGAAAALAGGASLLAAGVTRVEGRFARGDLVTIAGPAGAVASGLVAYDAADAAALAGRRNADHAAILGHAPRAALVHRDDMVRA